MAARTHSEHEEDDIITEHMKVLLLDDHESSGSLSITMPPQEEESSTFTTTELTLREHYMSSIESTLVIRQLPSQGLSFQLWPAATTLVTLLDHHRRRHSSSDNKKGDDDSPLSSTLASLSKSGGSDHSLNILELGSGTGLVGIAAAVLLAANVTVTDLPHVIPNLQFNVDANGDLLALHGGTVHVAPLRWGDAGDVEALGRECFDLVLASDVVYYDHLYDPLLKTLRLLMLGGEDEKKNKKKMKKVREIVFVMAHLRRWKKDSAFFKKAKKVFNVETLHVDSPCNGCRIGVVVYRFARKHHNFNTNFEQS